MHNCILAQLCPTFCNPKDCDSMSDSLHSHYSISGYFPSKDSKASLDVHSSLLGLCLPTAAVHPVCEYLFYCLYSDMLNNTTHTHEFLSLPAQLFIYFLMCLFILAELGFLCGTRSLCCGTWVFLLPTWAVSGLLLL